MVLQEKLHCPEESLFLVKWIVETFLTIGEFFEKNS
jgi:hypothetical protein